MVAEIYPDTRKLARLNGESLADDNILQDLEALVTGQRVYDEAPHMHSTELVAISAQIEALEERKKSLLEESETTTRQTRAEVCEISDRLVRRVEEAVVDGRINPIYAAAIDLPLRKNNGFRDSPETIFVADLFGRGLVSLDQTLKQSPISQPVVRLDFLGGHGFKDVTRRVRFGMTEPNEGLKLEVASEKNGFDDCGHLYPHTGSEHGLPLPVNQETLGAAEAAIKWDGWSNQFINEGFYLTSTGKKISLADEQRHEEDVSVVEGRLLGAIPEVVAIPVSLPGGNILYFKDSHQVAMFDTADGIDELRLSTAGNFCSGSISAIGVWAVERVLTVAKNNAIEKEKKVGVNLEVVADMLDFAAESLGITLPVFSKKQRTVV